MDTGASRFIGAHLVVVSSATGTPLVHAIGVQVHKDLTLDVAGTVVAQESRLRHTGAGNAANGSQLVAAITV